jgi:hypothetical protein
VERIENLNEIERPINWTYVQMRFKVNL